MTYKTMVTGSKCINCGHVYNEGRYFEGCKKCRTSTFSSNLTVTYNYKKLKNIFTKDLVASRNHNLWRYRELLPVRSDFIISLGEGGTPLIQCNKIAENFNMNTLFIKDESMNPTWSFKDRLASVAISKACEFGISTVVVSSTGNQGAATAAYAAHAGLQCVIFTLEDVPKTMKVLMQIYDAKVVSCENLNERWKLMSKCIKKYNWYPISNYVSPPVGSNYYGIEGYKTIAFEIVEDLGWKAPDVFIASVAYADGLFGIWKGFKELKKLGFIDRLPRMVAAEVFGSLSNGLVKGNNCPKNVPTHPTIAFSIATPISSFQGLKSLIESNGIAVTVTDEEILKMQIELGKKEGIFAEPSSIASLVGAKKLRIDDWIKPWENVVCLNTSSGLKDINTAANNIPKIPLVGSSIDELSKTLKETYNFVIEK